MKHLVGVGMKIAALALACALAAPAQQQPPQKPISRTGLIEALKIGGLSPQEMIDYIRQRGVDFQMTAETESELKSAGARPELITAVRENYRPQNAAPAAPPPQSAPPQTAPPPQQAAPPAQSAPAQPPATEPAPLQQADPGALLKMRTIFIDKMPNDLDQFIRAEIGKKLGGRLLVVLVKEEADAFMTGAGEHRTGTGAAITGRYLGLHDTATGAVSIIDKSGRYVLWSSEAGDRSLLFGVMKRGGPRKVADRLVSNLKKALEGR